MEVFSTKSSLGNEKASLPRCYAELLVLRPCWNSRHLAALQPASLIRDKLCGSCVPHVGNHIECSLLDCKPAVYEVVHCRPSCYPKQNRQVDAVPQTSRVNILSCENTRIILLPALPPSLQYSNIVNETVKLAWKPVISAIRLSLGSASLESIGLPRPRLIVVAGPYRSGKTSAVARAVSEVDGATFVRMTARDALSQNVTKVGLEPALLRFIEEAAEFAPAAILIDDAHFVFPPTDDSAFYALQVAAECLARRVLQNVIVVLVCSPDEFALHPSVMQIADMILRSVQPCAVDSVSGSSPVTPFSASRTVTENGKLEAISAPIGQLSMVGDDEQRRLCSNSFAQTKVNKSATEQMYMPRERTSIALERIRGTGLASNLVTIVEPRAPTSIQDREAQAKLGGVAGLQYAKQVLLELTLWAWTRGSTFEVLQTVPHRGALLYGPPGTGKTLLVRETANACQAVIMAVDAATLARGEIGTSENILKTIYSTAENLAPTIIFLDEIDALFAGRQASCQTDSSSLVRLSSALMLALDRQGNGIVTIGATNRPWLLPRNLMRAGRLERCVHVGLPCAEDRVALADLYGDLLGMDLSEVSLLQDWARSDSAMGLSGADLAGACRRAAIQCAQEGGDMNASHIINCFLESGPFVGRVEADMFAQWVPP